jgi:hypothetical protein
MAVPAVTSTSTETAATKSKLKDATEALRSALEGAALDGLITRAELDEAQNRVGQEFGFEKLEAAFEAVVDEFEDPLEIVDLAIIDFDKKLAETLKDDNEVSFDELKELLGTDTELDEVSRELFREMVASPRVQRYGAFFSNEAYDLAMKLLADPVSETEEPVDGDEGGQTTQPNPADDPHKDNPAGDGIFRGEIRTNPSSEVKDKKIHVHPKLKVVIDGKEVPVPANVGIDKELWKDRSLDEFGHPTMAAMHTHDGSGKIHVESTKTRDYTLGEFLAIWGLDLEGKDVTVTAQGQDVGANWQNLVFQDGMEVVLEAK